MQTKIAAKVRPYRQKDPVTEGFIRLPGNKECVLHPLMPHVPTLAFLTHSLGHKAAEILPINRASANSNHFGVLDRHNCRHSINAELGD